MEDVFNFIARNIYILLPLAIFIGIRIMDAKKKAENSGSQKKKSSMDAGDLFKAFGEEDPARRTGNTPVRGMPWNDDYTPPKFEPAKKPVQPAKRKQIKQKPQSIAEYKPLVVETPTSGTITASPTEKPTQTSTPIRPGNRIDFNERMKTLTPLQKAVAMAEILGQPKGSI